MNRPPNPPHRSRALQRTGATLRPGVVPDLVPNLVHVFVRDLELEAVIGVHRHEKRRAQPLRLNIDLSVRGARQPERDTLAQVVDYEQVVKAVRAIAAEGPTRLIETLAERIAAHCLSDPRVLAARIRVEKLTAIPGAASVGVEIERARPDLEAREEGGQP